MKLKELEERKAELLEQVELENNSETRSIEKIDELLKEIDEVNASIEKEKEVEERLLKLNLEGEKPMVKETEVRTLDVQNAEIREAIELGKELDITNFEVEERGISFAPNAGVAGATKDVNNIAKKSFANYILEKATDKHTLFGKIRHEAMTAATHQIPVQKTVIDEFQSVTELANYNKKNFDFDVVNLGAHKYGNIVQFSDEALKDTGYDLMGQLLKQYQNGLARTLEKLVVKGENQIQGLEGFTGGDGSHKVAVQSAELAAGTMTDEKAVELIEQLYRKLPVKYRENATFVLSQDIVDALSFAKDGVGRLLVSYDYSNAPLGGKPQMYLLGCPVVVSPYVAATTGASATHKIAFFGDLSKAMIGSVRQNFTIKTSTEAGFMNDSTYVKATIRCDVKRGLAESMAFIEVE